MIGGAAISPVGLLAVLALGGLTACGPTSPNRAYEICSDRARAAAGPTGQIGLGVGSGGRLISDVEVEISTDYLRGRDPQRVYDSCFRQLTGAGPTRPLLL